MSVNPPTDGAGTKTEPGFWFRFNLGTPPGGVVIVWVYSDGPTLSWIDELSISMERATTPMRDKGWCYVGSESDTSPWIRDYPLEVQSVLYTWLLRKFEGMRHVRDFAESQVML